MLHAIFTQTLLNSRFLMKKKPKRAIIMTLGTYEIAMYVNNNFQKQFKL